MAIIAYLQVTGTKSGAFTGAVTTAAHANWIGVIGVDYSVMSPHDTATGMASGKRQHRPLRITKETDKSSPQFFNALVTNEVLKTCTLAFVKTSASGIEEPFSTIVLTNASVASLQLVMPDPKTVEASKSPLFEAIDLTFQKIEWTMAGGKTVQDDWRP